MLRHDYKHLAAKPLPKPQSYLVHYIISLLILLVLVVMLIVQTDYSSALEDVVMETNTIQGETVGLAAQVIGKLQACQVELVARDILSGIELLEEPDIQRPKMKRPGTTYDL